MQCQMSSGMSSRRSRSAGTTIGVAPRSRSHPDARPSPSAFSQAGGVAWRRIGSAGP
jgi:hypothetical protein